jgi:ubiquinone/menaquinone biosynthesis C-methylase UbiE
VERLSESFGEGWEAAYSQHDGTTLWSEEPIACIGDVIEEFRRREYRTVLDVGCGDGRNLLPLAESGFVCAGVDISTTALGRAAAHLGGMALLVRADASELEAIPDASVHAITCFDLFGQIPYPENMLANFARVLLHNGMVALNAFTPRDSEYGQGDRVDSSTFIYKDTLFRFFEEQDLRRLLDGWSVERLEQQSWVDPPHGEFRPYEHVHDNWIVFLTRR